MGLTAEQRINPALLHRVAVIGAGTLDSLPHNGAVVTLLAVCGSTHGESYFDIVMVAIVGAVLALAAVIGLGPHSAHFSGQVQGHNATAMAVAAVNPSVERGGGMRLPAVTPSRAF